MRPYINAANNKGHGNRAPTLDFTGNNQSSLKLQACFCKRPLKFN